MHQVSVAGQVLAPEAFPSGAGHPRQAERAYGDQTGPRVAVCAQGHQPPAQSGADHHFHARAWRLREVTLNDDDDDVHLYRAVTPCCLYLQHARCTRYGSTSSKL